MADPLSVYSDGVQVAMSPFTVTLVFTENPVAAPGTAAPQTVATVRMSLEHAKVMAIIMRRQLKQYEEQLGEPIKLLPQVFQQLGLSPQEDW